MSWNEIRLAAPDNGLSAGLYEIFSLPCNPVDSSFLTSEKTEFYKCYLELNTLELLYRSVTLTWTLSGNLNLTHTCSMDPVVIMVTTHMIIALLM